MEELVTGQQESPDEGNNIIHSETTGAIKNLAVLKEQAVNGTGVKFGVEKASWNGKVRSHRVFYKLVKGSL